MLSIENFNIAKKKGKEKSKAFAHMGWGYYIIKYPKSHAMQYINPMYQLK